MNEDQRRLFDRFEQLGIVTQTHHHTPAFTVQEARDLRGEIEGGHCKNLFLKDKKGQVWLIVCLEDAQINLKKVPAKIGSARLSFGKPELLAQILGVEPGSVTPFALINDTDNSARVILEANMMVHDKLNFHPLKNDATTTILSKDLIKFVQSCGHEPAICDLYGL